MERAVIHTPIGPLTLEARDGFLVAVGFGGGPGADPGPGSLLERAAREIREYLEGRRTRLTVPYRLPDRATPFRRRVWAALERIPYGRVRTYGDLARELGTSPRAVGGACAANPLPLLVPCHRVVARDGLGGFAGQWQTGLALDVKRVLLDLEARVSGAR